MIMPEAERDPGPDPDEDGPEWDEGRNDAMWIDGADDCGIGGYAPTRDDNC
jgi:hypothetical protein